MKHYLSSPAILAMTALLAACGGESDSSNSASSTVVTLPLSVSVSAAMTTPERSSLTLQGTVTGGSGVTVRWSQVSGPMVEFDNAQTSITDITAPSVRNDTEVTLELTAQDSTGQTASQQVRITITDQANGPVGPSPQGIPDTGPNRRRDARGGRDARRMFDSREVRTYDGTSNNVAKADWGGTFIHLQRLAPSAYSDGVSSLAGSSRVSARVISNDIVNQDAGETIPNSLSGSDFVWQWGQFIDHDLDLTDGAEEAASIAIPSGDVFFDPDGTGTVEMGFNRALFDPDTGITAANPREQENEITSWIDGSMIYGSDDTRNAAIRVGNNSPYMKSSAGNLLPFNEDSLVNANGFISDPTQLFLAGDIRVNEQLALATLHTLWVREHNRLAAELERDFPSNTGDEIFELTRRLVIAKVQMITFEEWLPALLGPNAIPTYGGYDSSLNPSIYNEFSAAAFRLGHSMLNDQLLRLDANGDTISEGHLDLASAFFTAPMLLTSETSLDPILRGLATQRHQAVDAKVANPLRNFLFGAPGDGGLDLPALNIQRGRDHGLPDYNSMRVAMGLPRIASFDAISSDAATVAALSTSYASVDDIDLWIGGLAEDSVSGSNLGPLFQAIIVRQFTEIRDGDRFWYQNDLNADEMNRVRGTTLGRVIRANTSIGAELQDNVFVAP